MKNSVTGSHFTQRSLLALCLLLTIAFMSGCNTRSSELALRDAQFQYHKAIRWSLFDSAMKFTTEGGDISDQQRAFYDRVRVTSYVPKFQSQLDANKRVQQVVEIRYYIEPSFSEKSILDKQTWFYDEAVKSWRIEGTLPNF